MDILKQVAHDLEAGHWETAFRALAECLQKSPQDHDLWELIGQFFESQAEDREFFRALMDLDLRPLGVESSGLVSPAGEKPSAVAAPAHPAPSRPESRNRDRGPAQPGTALSGPVPLPQT